MASIAAPAARGIPIVNAAWDAAQAALALAIDCLGAGCNDYPRQLVETASPVADCNTLAVVIGSARAYSGSCVGKMQLSTNLDITLVRCCEPVGTLNDAGGYTPPTTEAIQAAVACLVRDAWAIYECLLCAACEVIGTVQGVSACCEETGAPEIIWGHPGGGCRSAIVRLPIVLTACCPEVAP